MFPRSLGGFTFLLRVSCRVGDDYTVRSGVGTRIMSVPDQSLPSPLLACLSTIDKATLACAVYNRSHWSVSRPLVL